MNRKLISACTALAAFAALAIGPATASATNDPQLTTQEGVLVEPGTPIKLTAIGETTMTSTAGTSNLVSCTTATGTGSLIKNSGGTVEGEVTSASVGGTGAGGDCTSSFGAITVTPLGLPWCVRSTPAMATDELQGSSGKCPGGGNIKFLLTITGVGNCEYEATGAIKGHFTTSPTDAQASVTATSSGSGVKKLNGSFLCPSSAAFRGTATARNEAGQPFYVS